MTIVVDLRAGAARLSALFSAIFLAVLAPGMPAAEDILTVTITRGVESALPVAVAPFGAPPDNAGARLIVETLRDVVAADLNGSGRVRVPPVDGYPQSPDDFVSVDFPAWQSADVQSLVIGRVVPSSASAYSVEFRLVDVYGATQVLGYRVPTQPDVARRTAHQIADIVYEALTGEPGVFATRIAYVSVDRARDGGRLYRLNIADSDGANPSALLTSREPVLSPAWSPDGRRIAYASLEGSRATLFLQDLRSGQRRAVSSGSGMHSAPAFSEDGQQIALTISKDGNPDIYVHSLKTGRTRRLTTSPAIDTEPTFAPDGETIAFTSDRGGTPQIYTVPSGGGRPERLTFDMGPYNARPRYAPDGRSLALVTRGANAGFAIGLVDLERGLLTTLTGGGLDESPSFAPNGRLIMYSTRRGSGSELAVVSVDGKVRQRLTLGASEVREPAWGPLPRR